MKIVQFPSIVRLWKGEIGSLKLLIWIAGSLIFVSLGLAQSPADKQASLKPKAPYRVAILPVVIHSPENIGYIREGLLDMLSSRVELADRVHVLEKGTVKKAAAQESGEIDNETARKIGQALDADYVVFGSLTKLGDSASLDLRIVDVKGEKAAQSVFIQAGKMEEIVAKIDDLARGVDEKVLGYPLTPVVAEKRGPVAAPKEMAAVEPTIPAFRPVAPGQAGGEFWQSKPFPFEIVGMAIGDLDGKGQNEVVVIDERNLYIYSWEKEFRQIKKIEGGRLDRFLAVEVVDVRKNGRPEIFVTCAQLDRFASFVVAYRDGNFQIVAKDLAWFLRGIELEGKGRVLLGQRKGPEQGLTWPISEIGFDGKSYRDLRDLDLPRGLTINGFSPFSYEGKSYYAFIDTDSRLKVMNTQGKIVWKSREPYGSSNGFRIKPIPTAQAGPDSADDILFVNARVVNQGNEIYLIRNISPVADLFKRAKTYTRGEIQRLMWNGAVLMETWKSKEIQGYLADFQFANLSKEGDRALVLAVQYPKELFSFSDASSALMISRLQAAP